MPRVQEFLLTPRGTDNPTEDERTVAQKQQKNKK